MVGISFEMRNGEFMDGGWRHNWGWISTDFIEQRSEMILLQCLPILSQNACTIVFNSSLPPRVIADLLCAFHKRWLPFLSSQVTFHHWNSWWRWDVIWMLITSSVQHTRSTVSFLNAKCQSDQPEVWPGPSSLDSHFGREQSKKKKKKDKRKEKS